MDIEQIRELRRTLESDIAKLLIEFQTTSQVSIRAVEVRFEVLQSMDNSNFRNYVSHVGVKLEI